MKKLLVAPLLVAAGFGIKAWADDKSQKTVKGEVVDLACYLSEGEHGGKHVKCATSCISGGTPAGLLTEDGTLYVFIVHGKEGGEPMKFAGHMIEATGDVFEKGGMKGILTKSVKDNGVAPDAKDGGDDDDHEDHEHGK